MLTRYVWPRPLVPQVGMMEIQEIAFNEEEKDQVTRVLRLLQDLDSITMTIQGSCTGLTDACILFEGVMDKHPSI